MSDLKYRLMIVAGRLMYVWEGRKPLTNTVVFSNFSGKKYSDNPMYISEKLHELSPDTDIVWLRHKGYEFDTPDYVRVVRLAVEGYDVRFGHGQSVGGLPSEAGLCT